MPFLTERDKAALQERFQELSAPVKLVNFTQELECESCHETRRLLEEVAALSDKLSLEVYNFQLDKEKVEQYRIDKIPATVVEGEKDYGIRFFGLPSGYEFSVLIDDILTVSKGRSGLHPETVSKLRGLSHPLHLQVFVTPT